MVVLMKTRFARLICIIFWQVLVQVSYCRSEAWINKHSSAPTSFYHLCDRRNNRNETGLGGKTTYLTSSPNKAFPGVLSVLIFKRQAAAPLPQHHLPVKCLPNPLLARVLTLRQGYPQHKPAQCALLWFIFPASKLINCIRILIPTKFFRILLPTKSQDSYVIRMRFRLCRWNPNTTRAGHVIQYFPFSPPTAVN